MSKCHIECLLAPLAACVLSLPAGGCRDRGKIEAASIAPVAPVASTASAEAPPEKVAADTFETRDV